MSTTPSQSEHLVATVRLTHLTGVDDLTYPDPTEDYHEASRMYPGIVDATVQGGPRLERSLELRVSAARSVKRHPAVHFRPLPPPDLGNVLLSDALVRRRSRRQYADAPLATTALATVLAAAYGPTFTADGTAAVVPQRAVRRRALSPRAVRRLPSGRDARPGPLPLRPAPARARAPAFARSGRDGERHPVRRARRTKRGRGARNRRVLAIAVQVRPARISIHAHRGRPCRAEHRYSPRRRSTSPPSRSAASSTVVRRRAARRRRAERGSRSTSSRWDGPWPAGTADRLGRGGDRRTPCRAGRRPARPLAQTPGGGARLRRAPAGAAVVRRTRAAADSASSRSRPSRAGGCSLAASVLVGEVRRGGGDLARARAGVPCSARCGLLGALTVSTLPVRGRPRRRARGAPPGPPRDRLLFGLDVPRHGSAVGGRRRARHVQRARRRGSRSPTGDVPFGHWCSPTVRS